VCVCVHARVCVCVPVCVFSTCWVHSTHVSCAHAEETLLTPFRLAAHLLQCVAKAA
jgi:hypothetical protein